LTRHDYSFREERLRTAIDAIAKDARINAVYHVSSLGSVDSVQANFEASNMTAPAALDFILSGHSLRSIQIGGRTIMVVGAGYGPGASVPVETLVAKSGTNRLSEEAGQSADQPRTTDFRFKGMSLYAALQAIAQGAHVNLVYDPALDALVKGTTFSVELRDVTPGQALEFILKAYDWTYAQIDGNSIKISAGKNPPALSVDEMLRSGGSR